VVRVIDENPSNLNEYGLSNPRIEVDFRRRRQEYRKLFIGEKSPTGGDLFAKRNDEKKVFLSAFQNRPQQDTFALRDKVVLKFDARRWTEVEVAAPGNRGDGEGRARVEDQEAVETRADYGSVKGSSAACRRYR